MRFEETMIKLTNTILLQSRIIDELYKELSQQAGAAAAELPIVADIEKAAALIRELEKEL